MDSTVADTLHYQQHEGPISPPSNNIAIATSRELVSPISPPNNIINGLGLLAATANSVTNTNFGSYSGPAVGLIPGINNNNNNIVGGYPSPHHLPLYNIPKPSFSSQIIMDLQEASTSPNNVGGTVNVKMEPDGEVTSERVPITVRSDLPQFKGVTVERVHCGIDITWMEFLTRYNVNLDPDLHIVKGSGGRKANLRDKIGDYVKILKRRMKVYLVNIEMMHPSKRTSKSKSSNSSTCSATKGTNADEPDYPNTKRGKNGTASAALDNEGPAQPVSKRKSKKPKMIQVADEESKASHVLGNQDSIEIPEKSVSMETQVFSNSDASTGQPPKQRKKRQNRKNIIQGNGNAMTNGTTVNPPHGFLDNFSQYNINPNEQALNLVNTHPNQVPRVNSTLGYVNLMPNLASAAAPDLAIGLLPLNYSNNNGPPADMDNDLSSTSSNGGGEDDDTSNRSESVLGVGDFHIKPAVVQYLVHKISNKNMLRIRDELMAIRNDDNYFKLTSVAPLAAGLLEQMFCRGPPRVESN